jgi:hypothetical protein
MNVNQKKKKKKKKKKKERERLTSIGPFDHSAVPDSILPSHNPN